MVQSLYQWTMSWADSPYAVPALFLLACAESSFFPLPPDILLVALTLAHPSMGLYYAAITTVGSVLGGVCGYGIGRLGGRPLLLRLMGADRVRYVHDVFERHERWAILIASLTPVPYKLFTIGAGAFDVNLRVFVVASIIGRGARFFLVAGVLQALGPWMRESLDRYFNLFTIAVVVAFGLGVWIVKRYSKPPPTRSEPPASGVKSP